MRELSRIALYSELLNREGVLRDNYLNVIRYNYEMLINVEDKFLTDDIFSDADDNSSSSKSDISQAELVLSIRENIQRIRENQNYTTDVKIAKSMASIEKIGNVVDRGDNSRGTSKHLFNKVINELGAYNRNELTRNNLPSYMQNNDKEMPQVFLSYAYDDNLYTCALFDYFYKQGIYLYVDWMHHGKLNDGIVIKENLQKVIRNSSQLLFMRTLNSELDMQGKHMIRSWCSWELGNFYSSIGATEKYFFNLYSIDGYASEQLDGLKLYTKVEMGKIQGIDIIHKK